MRRRARGCAGAGPEWPAAWRPWVQDPCDYFLLLLFLRALRLCFFPGGPPGPVGFAGTYSGCRASLAQRVRGEDFHVVAVRVSEVNASPPIAAIHLTGVTVRRIGVEGYSSTSDSLEDGVELVLADQKGTVLPSVLSQSRSSDHDASAGNANPLESRRGRERRAVPAIWDRQRRCSGTRVRRYLWVVDLCGCFSWRYVDWSGRMRYHGRPSHRAVWPCSKFAEVGDPGWRRAGISRTGWRRSSSCRSGLVFLATAASSRCFWYVWRCSPRVAHRASRVARTRLRRARPRMPEPHHGHPGLRRRSALPGWWVSRFPALLPSTTGSA